MLSQSPSEMKAAEVRGGVKALSGPANTVDRQTIRKVQRRLLPLLFLLYVVAFVDRINIGFAALTMNKELAISSEQFGFAAGIFFFGYFLFEVPSNLLLHRIGARIWITRILVTWGILATLTGGVRTIHQLYLMRFLLGLAEAGYFPGIVLYLTYWFRARERAQAIALFLLGGPVTSIVGAPISGLILDHVHWFGMSSWRWLLILEGLPAVACGLLTYFLLPSRPEEAGFLTSAEKEALRRDLLQEEEQKLSRHRYSVFQTVVNARVWYLAVTNFGALIGSYALHFWAPQLLKSALGEHSNSSVGVLVIVPHLIGLVAMVLVSRSSDRRLERRYHAGVPALVGGLALLMIVSFHTPALLIVLLSLLAIGIYGRAGPFWAMPSEFLTGSSAAVGIGLINSVANLGGFVGPYVIGAMSNWTGGIYGSLALTGLPLLLSGFSLLLAPNGVRLLGRMRQRSQGVRNYSTAKNTSGVLQCATGEHASGIAICRGQEQIIPTRPV